MLETIYITRHGFRSNWVVSQTGTYTATIKSPTGIPSDPPLASHGVDQANELAAHIVTLNLKPEIIYSSPFYRCLQTIEPVAKKLGLGIGGVEGGIGEWFGIAPFDHPSPASPQILKSLFSTLDADYKQQVTPATRGETMAQVHDRAAFTLARIIDRLDKLGEDGPKTILLCTHAATNIALGRALVGDENFDVKTGTCSLSTYHRKSPSGCGEYSYDLPPTDKTWNMNEEQVPILPWRNGNGVAGGWECVVNGDCSFLSEGEERNWWFGGDEAWDFLVAPGTGVCAPEKKVDDAQGDAMGKSEKDQSSKI